MSNVVEMGRAQRIKVFQDTLEWIKEDDDLTEGVSYSSNISEVYKETYYPAYWISEDNRDTSCTVSLSRTFEAARRLRTKYPSEKIAVLNFANAFVPGGGVAEGCSAQEECLCRESTLYPVLKRVKKEQAYGGDWFYFAETETKDLASDNIIYTEDIIVCKTDEDIPKRLPKEDWFEVDVITMAAPDLRRVQISDDDLYRLHLKRANHMLTCAASNNAKVLVLGAFGCGVFQNNTDVVAKAYHDAIYSFPYHFEVEFAIYGKDEEDANYKAFKKIFG